MADGVVSVIHGIYLPTAGRDHFSPLAEWRSDAWRAVYCDALIEHGHSTDLTYAEGWWPVREGWAAEVERAAERRWHFKLAEPLIGDECIAIDVRVSLDMVLVDGPAPEVVASTWMPGGMVSVTLRGGSGRESVGAIELWGRRVELP